MVGAQIRPQMYKLQPFELAMVKMHDNDHSILLG